MPLLMAKPALPPVPVDHRCRVDLGLEFSRVYLRFLPSFISHHPFKGDSLNHRLRFGGHYTPLHSSAYHGCATAIDMGLTPAANGLPATGVSAPLLPML